MSESSFFQIIVGLFVPIQHEATADEKDITELLPKMIILAMRKWNGV